MVTWSESSLQKGRLSSVNREACALLQNGVLYCVARDEVVGFDFLRVENASGYRTVAAIKWASLGVFSVMSRLAGYSFST